MRIMYKNMLGTKTTNIIEVTEAVVVEEERAVYCLCNNEEHTMLKFVPNENLIRGILSKVKFDLIGLGYFDFTQHWDAYTKCICEEDNSENWLLVSKIRES